MTPQDRLLILVDHYQRTAVETLQQAKVAHDAAFSVGLTLEDQAAAVNGVIDAVGASYQALVALRGVLNCNPDIPAGPAMATPIMRLN